MACASFSATKWMLPLTLALAIGAADLVHRAFLAGHGLDDFRPADEHVGGALDHDDEVHQGRGIGRAAGAGAGDDRDLRHDARDQHVAEKDLAVAGERIVAFLDARAAGIVEADDRAARPSWRNPSGRKSSWHECGRASRR